MGFFKEFKDDFSQAVNELMPGEDSLEETGKQEDLVVNTLEDEVDVEGTCKRGKTGARSAKTRAGTCTRTGTDKTCTRSGDDTGAGNAGSCKREYNNPGGKNNG